MVQKLESFIISQRESMFPKQRTLKSYWSHWVKSRFPWTCRYLNRIWNLSLILTLKKILHLTWYSNPNCWYCLNMWLVSNWLLWFNSYPRIFFPVKSKKDQNFEFWLRICCCDSIGYSGNCSMSQSGKILY
jgi:hypothetical protein